MAVLFFTHFFLPTSISLSLSFSPILPHSFFLSLILSHSLSHYLTLSLPRQAGGQAHRDARGRARGRERRARARALAAALRRPRPGPLQHSGRGGCENASIASQHRTRWRSAARVGVRIFVRACMRGRSLRRGCAGHGLLFHARPCAARARVCACSLDALDCRQRKAAC
eukprot:471003-Pleurochrysis_carterae.AAC.1